MPNTNLAGKSVIITGGASGIGLAVVKFFASQSSKISILDISAASAQSVVASLRTEFPSVTFLFKKCDISNWDEQKAVFDQVYNEFGGIDIVFANAGISEAGKFLEKEDGEPTKPNLKTLSVNLEGTLYSVKLAIHYMRKKTTAYKGSIVCTASNAGVYPFPVAPIYATSKHAVVGAVRSLARPLEPEGIQINALAPAVIATNLAPDLDLFSNMILTPVSTAVNAVEEFVTNSRLTGVIAEISGDSFTFRAPPDFVDEDTGKNLETFWRLGYA